MKKIINTAFIVILKAVIIALILISPGCKQASTSIDTTNTETQVEIQVETKATETVTETTPIETKDKQDGKDPDKDKDIILSPEIVFSSSDGSQSTIYTCNSDGSNLQTLLEGGIYTSPSWDREHSKIVFTSINPTDGVSGIYIYDIKNKSKTLLLERFSPMSPSFSPDSSTVIFADFAEEDTENLEIYTIGIDGNNLTRLTENPARDYFPKYSPDGKSIVFSSERDGNIQLYTMNSIGEDIKRLMEDEFIDNSGMFSPDGLNIIFDSNRGGNSDIYVINSDGSGEIKNLTSNSADDFEPCYSPDGSMIVYRSNMDLGNSMSYDIFVMTVSGSNQTNITPYLNDTNEFGPSWY